jgi:DNA-binding NarL/FixJ family response regulator
MEVLLVDDQPVTVQVFAASVRKTFGGARVHTAVDLPEALQIAAARDIDLVLLDLKMPTCDGVQAVERFHRAFPDVPILVVSATESPERIRACMEAGACGYVPKTLAVAALSEAMQTVARGGMYLPPPSRGALH